MIRISTVENQPPKCPAVMPTSVPMATDSSGREQPDE